MEALRIMSPYLFNIYSERIMRNVKAAFEGGVQIGGERLNNLSSHTEMGIFVRYVVSPFP